MANRYDYTIVLFVLLLVSCFLFISRLKIMPGDGSYPHEDVSRPCDSQTVTYISNDDEDFQSIDCNALCGRKRSTTKFRRVLVTDDVFINGQRPARPGVYCVSEGTSVIKCNTATSRLVPGQYSDQWACQPLWPAVFGGADGGDILVCGGKLSDGDNEYEFRMPPSIRLAPIVDPYNEVKRFFCTPGQYANGPRDYMNNRYLSLTANRFRRVRNDCAKYVTNALSAIRPVEGRNGYCYCLPSHGRLRRADELRNTDPEMALNEPRTFVNEAYRSGDKQLSDTVRETMVEVPHACSPCVAGGDLRSTDGVVNFPVQCTKANQSYFNGISKSDKMPCGKNGFGSASHPACVNTQVFIGDHDTSYLVKNAVKRIVGD